MSDNDTSDKPAKAIRKPAAKKATKKSATSKPRANSRSMHRVTSYLSLKVLVSGFGVASARVDSLVGPAGASSAGF